MSFSDAIPLVKGRAKLIFVCQKPMFDVILSCFGSVFCILMTIWQNYCVLLFPIFADKEKHEKDEDGYKGDCLGDYAFRV